MPRLIVYLLPALVLFFVGIGVGLSFGSRGVTATVTVTETETVTTTATLMPTRSSYTATVTFTLTTVTTSIITVTSTTTITLKPKYVVEFLGDREYFDRVLELLDKAQKSVYIAMYILKYDPREWDDPVNILLYKLVKLHKKGVDVRIIVDDYTVDRYYETIRYLKENGVEVRLDPRDDVRLHAKIVIVDGEWVIVGSHNWSESGLSYNYEAAILTNKQETVAEALRYFNNLWENSRPIE